MTLKLKLMVDCLRRRRRAELLLSFQRQAIWGLYIDLDHLLHLEDVLPRLWLPGRRATVSGYRVRER